MRILATFFMLIALSPAAYAYIDPSSTLFAWQGALALLGGLLVFVKAPVSSLKRFVAPSLQEERRRSCVTR